MGRRRRRHGRGRRRQGQHRGGAGLDLLKGGDGGDTILGGASSDTIDGGGGLDLGVWDGTSPVVIDVYGVGRMVARQSGFTDMAWGIEYVRTGGNDRAIMAGGNNLLDLGHGDDYARGGRGHDTLLGSDGDDQLSGQDGRDIINGGEGLDRLLGGTGNDTILGGADDDELFGCTGGEDMLVVTRLLHDGAWADGSIADDVYALSSDFGASTTLVALTEDGWRGFAKLVGHANTASVAAAIQDGTLFHGALPNDGGPGGFDL